MKVLFVSRAFPPSVGGIERQNYEISRALGEHAEVKTIANRRGRSFLPLFYPLALIRVLAVVRRHDVVLLGDGVLALLGIIVKWLGGRPVCCIVHGLDVTYPSTFYQRIWVSLALRRLDLLIAVGRQTITEMTARGVVATRCRVIPNGVRVDGLAPPIHQPSDGLDRPIKREHFRMLTLGRLVERKGVGWFISEVVPQLPKDVHYIVAGDGPHRAQIERAISELDDPSQVTMVGMVTEIDKRRLMASADVFVQPNIRVEGDIEGFGLVVLEAAGAGLPVIAADLEGLKDAIVDGENGLLVEPGDEKAYKETLMQFYRNPELGMRFGRQASQFVQTNFRWDRIATTYLAELSALVDRTS